MRAIASNQGYRPAYVQVGHWLANNTALRADVASIGIGVIGYLSGRPILDTMGLVSPDMMRHQVGWTETLAHTLDVHQPDYSVALPNAAWDGIIDTWWFQTQYEPLAHFSEVTIYHLRRSIEQLVEMPFQVDYVDGLALTGARLSSGAIQPGKSWQVWLQVDAQSQAYSRNLFALYLADIQPYERFAGITAEPLDGRNGSSTADQRTMAGAIEVPDRPKN